MTVVRLLADDLTGALDTAAEFVPLSGPIPVTWGRAAPRAGGGSFAFDTGTREQPAGRAADAAAGLAPALAGGDGLSFKKLDSLLRGPSFGELAACWRSGLWERCVVAPAFPHQGRITRDGRQLVREPDGSWRIVADLAASLAEFGVTVARGRPGQSPAPGVTVFDAETDEHLRAVAASGREVGGRLLWCGSAGLARALSHGAPEPERPALRGPILGLFGSDQDVTARQLSACEPWRVRVRDDPPATYLVGRQLERDGAVLASVELADGLSREEAATRIATTLGNLARALDRPGTLLVAGGETLRALCEALGTTSLEVRGQLEPGLPHSAMVGGRWDGLTVVSKSGAFGGPTLWRDLLDGSGLLTVSGPPAEKVSA